MRCTQLVTPLETESQTTKTTLAAVSANQTIMAPSSMAGILSRRWVSVGVMSAAEREFDIVLYGATGFVGKLTAEYLAAAGGDARIALAGRSPDKLLAGRETLGDKAQSWQLLTADADQPSTLNAMAAQTQVVVSTVGPYIRYGVPL